MRLRFAATLLLTGLFLTSFAGSAGAVNLGQLLNIGGQPPAVTPESAQAPVVPVPGPVAPAITTSDPSGSAVPANSGDGRRVVYALADQRVWLVNENGSTLGTWLVSGRAGEPNPGNYSVFSRSRHARAKAAGVSMEFMVRFVRTSGLPIGFHSIPVNRRGAQIQSIEELGTFQSLGCVRQRYEDAVIMWDFAQIGTPVIVVR